MQRHRAILMTSISWPRCVCSGGPRTRICRGIASRAWTDCTRIGRSRERPAGSDRRRPVEPAHRAVRTVPPRRRTTTTCAPRPTRRSGRSRRRSVRSKAARRSPSHPAWPRPPPSSKGNRRAASPSRPRWHTAASSLLFAEQVRLGRMTVREVDITDTSSDRGRLDGADLIWVESPTNPLLGDRRPAPDRRSRSRGRGHGVRRLDVQYPARRPPARPGRGRRHARGDQVAGRPFRPADGRARHPLAGACRRAADPTHPHRGDARRTGMLSLPLRGLRTLAVRMERAQAQRPASSPPAVERAPARRAGALPGSADRPVPRAGDPAASRLRSGDLVRGRRVGRRRRGGVRARGADHATPPAWAGWSR